MPEDQRRRASFPTTRITLIHAAQGGSGPQALEALSALCRAYWYPIYAYVRRLGYSPDAAEDLTQGFFTRVLEKHYLRDFQRERGRFRSFLLVSLKHFVANERDRAQAQKRGGAQTALTLDDVLRSALHDAERRYSLEPRDSVTPERIFERQWALTVLTRVQDRMLEEADAAGQRVQFERLKGLLVGEDSDVGYRALAAELDTTEGALKVAIHRLRQRFKERLREEIAHTVASPDEVGDELRYLLAALRT
jgi:DNA-directed RNA polymerase specialized sigma24 family protein